MRLSSRSVPSGPGSRGGRYHDPDWRRAYHRAWRAAHPEYQERERLRRARARAIKRGEDPTLITEPPVRLTPRLPVLAAHCDCQCGCSLELPPVCGLCLSDLHESA